MPKGDRNSPVAQSTGSSAKSRNKPTLDITCVMAPAVAASRMMKMSPWRIWAISCARTAASSRGGSV